MQLITEEYRKLNETLHASNAYFGKSGHKWAVDVIDLALSLRTQDILDYGCGKSTLAHNIPFRIKQYDPCVPKYSRTPEPAELVVCTDVLEHIEPGCLDSVLDDLKRVTKNMGFFVIANGMAKKNLPDGRNAHLIQEHASWWLPKIFQRFDILNFNVQESEEHKEHFHFEEYIIVVRSKANLKLT